MVDLLGFYGLIAIAVFFLLKFVETLHFPWGRRKNYAFQRSGAGAQVIGVGDSVDQLRNVMSANFFKKKVMNKAEYRVFKEVEAEVWTLRKGYRVLSQTSLGEIIGSDDKRAFQSVNSKRVDILVMGPYGDPLVAIEYQGGGHHQGTAAARDAVKREALRRAGVHFIEVLESHTSSEIGQLVRRVL